MEFFSLYGNLLWRESEGFLTMIFYLLNKDHPVLVVDIKVRSLLL